MIINARDANSQSRSINKRMPTLQLHYIDRRIRSQYEAATAVSIPPGKSNRQWPLQVRKEAKSNGRSKTTIYYGLFACEQPVAQSTAQPLCLHQFANPWSVPLLFIGFSLAYNQQHHYQSNDYANTYPPIHYLYLLISYAIHIPSTA